MAGRWLVNEVADIEFLVVQDDSEGKMGVTRHPDGVVTLLTGDGSQEMSDDRLVFLETEEIEMIIQFLEAALAKRDELEAETRH